MSHEPTIISRSILRRFWNPVLYEIGLNNTPIVWKGRSLGYKRMIYTTPDWGATLAAEDILKYSKRISVQETREKIPGIINYYNVKCTIVLSYCDKEIIKKLKKLPREDHTIIIPRNSFNSYRALRKVYRKHLITKYKDAIVLHYLKPQRCPKQEARVQEWNIVRKKGLGDSKDIDFEYTYKGNTNNVIMDVGGFIGLWTDRMLQRHPYRSIIYEPMKKYFEIITDKFKRNNEVIIFNAGLGRKDCTIQIEDKGIASTAFTSGKGRIEECYIMDVSKEIIRVLEEEKERRIGIMKINIEGGEYDLLERMIEANMLGLIDIYHIQFHTFADNAHARICKIRKELSKTHYLQWGFPWVWERWILRGAQI